MYQDSLDSYKKQVYNPGSPHPTPKAEPFKTFPKELDFSSAEANPSNPLKITFSAKRKRPIEEEFIFVEETSTTTSSKKVKMMKKEEVTVNQFKFSVFFSVGLK